MYFLHAVHRSCLAGMLKRSNLGHVRVWHFRTVAIYNSSSYNTVIIKGGRYYCLVRSVGKVHLCMSLVLSGVTITLFLDTNIAPCGGGGTMN